MKWSRVGAVTVVWITCAATATEPGSDAQCGTWVQELQRCALGENPEVGLCLIDPDTHADCDCFLGNPSLQRCLGKCADKVAVGVCSVYRPDTASAPPLDPAQKDVVAALLGLETAGEVEHW
jgi:hypothetical protein